jgi:hypothetical protein
MHAQKDTHTHTHTHPDPQRSPPSWRTSSRRLAPPSCTPRAAAGAASSSAATCRSSCSPSRCRRSTSLTESTRSCSTRRSCSTPWARAPARRCSRTSSSAPSTSRRRWSPCSRSTGGRPREGGRGGRGRMWKPAGGGRVVVRCLLMLTALTWQGRRACARHGAWHARASTRPIPVLAPRPPLSPKPSRPPPPQPGPQVLAGRGVLPDDARRGCHDHRDRHPDERGRHHVGGRDARAAGRGVRVHRRPRLGLGPDGARRGRSRARGAQRQGGTAYATVARRAQAGILVAILSRGRRPPLRVRPTPRCHQSGLVVSEVQPLQMRAAGTALGTMINFMMSFIVGQFFLTLMCSTKAYVFLFFAGELLKDKRGVFMTGTRPGPWAHQTSWPTPEISTPGSSPPQPLFNPKRLAAVHGAVCDPVCARDQGRAHRGHRGRAHQEALVLGQGEQNPAPAPPNS